MMFQRNKIGMAIGAIMGATAVVAPVQASNLATDGLGEALIFPFYTVHGGNQSLFNITNTSDVTVAARLRFRESENSRDVFDFVVVLSPKDVFNGWVEYDETYGARFLTNDQDTCTVPEIQGYVDPIDPEVRGVPFSLLNLGDGGSEGVDRVREGYVEVIQLGSATGEPADCATIQNQFNDRTPNGWSNLQTVYNGYVENPLKGVMNINAAVGQNTAIEPVVIADFYDIATGGTSLVTLQLPPVPGVIGLADPTQRFLASYHQPTLASSNTYADVLLDDGQVGSTERLIAAAGGLTPSYVPNLTGAGGISYLLTRDSVINQWSRKASGAAWTTSTDWVVLFPTKNFFVDSCTEPQCGRAAGRPGLPVLPGIYLNTHTTSPFWEPWDSTIGLSCDPVTYRTWDRAENPNTTDPVFSPAPAGDALCHEVNVLTFLNGNVLASPNSYNVQSLPANASAGWMQLFLGSDSNLAAGSTPTKPIYRGLPVTGFGITSRIGGGLNDSVSFNHAYTRNPDPLSVGPVID